MRESGSPEILDPMGGPRRLIRLDLPSSMMRPSISCGPREMTNCCPSEHSLALIPALVAHGNLAVLCCIEREGCVVRLEKRCQVARAPQDPPPQRLITALGLRVRAALTAMPASLLFEGMSCRRTAGA
jgi:hypothetical protein